MKGKHSRRSILLPALLLLAGSLLCFLYFRQAAPDPRNDGLLRVCIDAGHGGDDPGAASPDGLRLEKDDCLSMALAVESAFHTHYPEIEVLLTRSDDTYLRLEERCAIANDWRADLFISLHRNSADGDAQGVEVWIPSGRPAAHKKLADAVMDGLETVGVTDARGTKSGTANNPSANYYVLGHTDMPSCLIELGFISSAADNRLFDTHHNAYAKAIADAAARLLLDR